MNDVDMSQVTAEMPESRPRQPRGRNECILASPKYVHTVVFDLVRFRRRAERKDFTIDIESTAGTYDPVYDALNAAEGIGRVCLKDMQDPEPTSGGIASDVTGSNGSHGRQRMNQIIARSALYQTA